MHMYFCESTSILIEGNKSLSLALPAVPSTPKSDPWEEESGVALWASRVAQTIADLQGFKFLRGALTHWALAPFQMGTLLPCPRTKTNTSVWNEYLLTCLTYRCSYIYCESAWMKTPARLHESLTAMSRFYGVQQRSIIHSIYQSLTQSHFICQVLLTKCWVVLLETQPQPKNAKTQKKGRAKRMVNVHFTII